MGFISNSEFRNKWEYVKAFKNAKDNSIKVLYSITETPISMYCKITNFAYGREDGVGNIKYTLEFSIIFSRTIHDYTFFIYKLLKYS